MDDLAAELARVLAIAEGFETFADAEPGSLQRSYLWGRIDGYRAAVKAVTEGTGVAPTPPSADDD